MDTFAALGVLLLTLASLVSLVAAAVLRRRHGRPLRGRSSTWQLVAFAAFASAALGLGASPGVDNPVFILRVLLLALAFTAIPVAISRRGRHHG